MVLNLNPIVDEFSGSFEAHKAVEGFDELKIGLLLVLSWPRVGVVDHLSTEVAVLRDHTVKGAGH